MGNFLDSFWIHVRGCLQAAIFITLILVVAGFLGRLHWILELCSHFRLQYMVCLALAAVVLFILGERFWSWISGGVSVLLIISILPYWFSSHVPETSTKPVSVLSFNLSTSNKQAEEIIKYFRSIHPDVILLMEIDQRWKAELEKLRSDYPFYVGQTREDNFGISLFSRLPLIQPEVIFAGKAGLPSIQTAVRLENGNVVHLIGTHPLPPSGKLNASLRNDQLKHLAERVAAIGSPNLIVAGDLNLTPFSPFFGDFLERSDLVHGVRGFGLYPTWMRRVPYLAIPIDHILVGSGIQVLDYRIGPALGSDHHPVFMECRLMPAHVAP